MFPLTKITDMRISIVIHLIGLLVLLNSLLHVPVFAQETAVYRNAHALFLQAKQHDAEGNYALAHKEFDTFMRSFAFSNAPEMAVMRTEAQFYHALTARKLHNANAELLLVKFIDENASSIFTSLAYFELGQIYFEQELYRDAIAMYNNVNTANLTDEQKADYNFQMAYSLFTSKQFNDAFRLFSQIINTKNQYYYDANYYYGVIAYFNKDYGTALSAFQRIEQNAKYDKTLPYYIALIYYQQGQFDQLMDYAAPKAKTPGIKYQTELNQLLGQTLFNRQKFTEALPYLEFYTGKSKTLRKEDYYQLGFAQYQLKRYNEAIINFTHLNNLNDSIGQNAMYHLADCYLQVNEKAKARNAFEVAARTNFDPVIKEISTFNYGKLSYELDFQTVATNVFRSFIKDYPTSKLSNEARQLLSTLLENAQNYKDAQQILEGIANKTPELNRAYQRVLYYRGVEFYNEQSPDSAFAYFDKAIKLPMSADVVALSHFWRGNILYKKKEYKAAVTELTEYLRNAGEATVSDKVSGATAKYTIGYAYFKLKDYKQAQRYFDESVANLKEQQLIANPKSVSGQIYPDAILRSGDCNFMQRQYGPALERYDDIVKYKMKGADYAYYQKAMLAGLIGDYDKKIDNLRLLIKNYPKSVYNDDAFYQIAITQVAQNNYQSAVETHQKLINDYPDSEFVPKSLVNLGLIYYNIGDYDRSLQFYELALKRFPKNIESREALTGVRDVFVAKGDADGYVQFAQKFPGMEISNAAQDSISYEIAETYYQRKDCPNATKEFTKYLAAHPNGAYVLYARYYRAICYYNAQDYEKSGKDFDYIAEQSRNPFTEESLNKGGRIALFITKDYQKAFNYYRKLYEIGASKELRTESLRGLVRASYYLKRMAELEQYSGLLLGMDTATPDDFIDANYFLGMLTYETKSYTRAKTYFQQVINRTTNEKGAQARYYLADMAFKQNDLDNALKLCMNVAAETPNQTEWVVRSYLLLADVYAAKGELFQAKATLQSIIANYKPEDNLKKEAREKLKTIEQQEAAQSKLQTGKPNTGGYLELEK